MKTTIYKGKSAGTAGLAGTLRSVRRFCLPVAGLLLLAAMTSCRDDEVDTPAQEGKEVTITLNVPQTGGATRAMPADEDAINTIDVLAFKTDTGDPENPSKGTYLYRTMATYTAPVSSFNVKFYSYGFNQTIVVLANCRNEVNTLISTGINETTTKASVIQSLALSQNFAFDAATMTGIPMWGEITNENITPTYNPSPALTVSLTRMLAKISVTNNDAANFSLQNAYLYNPRQKGTIIPDNWDGLLNKVNTPTAVTGGSYTLGQGVNFGPFPFSTTNKIEGKIYTFEANNATRGAADRLDATCVVVGGYYQGGTKLQYYRIDLMDGSNYMDVKRNHHYDITITSVTDNGYDDKEAAYRGDVKLKAEVKEWTPASQGVIGDEQFQLDVDVSDDGVIYRWKNNNKVTVNATTDYNITSQGLLSGIFVDMANTVYDPPVASGSEWLTLNDVLGGDGIATREFELSVNKTLASSFTGYEATAKVPVTAGNLTQMVKVTLMIEYYPKKHSGWAGSNIYWDDSAGQLTFDDVGDTTHQDYQGLYFQWGSLYGISPADAWSGSTKLYAPDGTDDTATNMGFAIWGTMPYISLSITSNPPSGKTARDRAYLYEITDKLGEIGDICKYMTDEGLAPAGSWRMPTSAEFNAASNYPTWTADPNDPANQYGTATFGSNRKRTDYTPNVYFPASGLRSTAGAIDRVGTNGYYWSATPFNQHGYYLYFHISTVNPDFINDRACGFPVRCVKE